jgi:TRAP-type C4-dicarboxylate transport system permease small subunit
VEEGLRRAESLIAIAGLLLLLLLSLAEIMARNFFHTAVPGAEVLDRYLVLWVSFLGAALAVHERHIRIDVVAPWLPAAGRRRLERPVFLFCAAVCGALGWAALRLWHEEWIYAPAGGRWITALGGVIPLGFLLLTLHYGLRFLIGSHAAGRAP